MEDGDPAKLTIQQLKSRITELGFHDELPNTHSSKEDYLEIYHRVSKKRTAALLSESNKRSKVEREMDIDEQIPTPEVVSSTEILEVQTQQVVTTTPRPVPPAPAVPAMQAVPPVHQSHPPPTRLPQRWVAPVVDTSTKHVKLAPFPSELPFIKRKVQSKAERAASFYNNIGVTILFLILARLVHYCCCTSTTFCDHEEILSSRLHSGCTPCPLSGFCANGLLHACQEPFQLYQDRCISEDELQSLHNPGVLHSLWDTWFCDALLVSTFTLLASMVVLLASWYWYWFCASQEEDEVVVGLLGEVTQVLSRANGQGFLPTRLSEEAAIKYPDYNMERIWSQVSMLLEKDRRLVKAKAEVDGVSQVVWLFNEGAR
eukprot:GGOE01013829.1.p1 GENE.GGOE01013829.1~~GGOE01013829.1.p1  ORF type:complete len:385 (-),score=29.86 GGOE01013829.1:337-1455(-)